MVSHDASPQRAVYFACMGFAANMLFVQWLAKPPDPSSGLIWLDLNEESAGTPSIVGHHLIAIQIHPKKLPRKYRRSHIFRSFVSHFCWPTMTRGEVHRGESGSGP